MYDAVNRMYDPQLGRFGQIDELAEASWEESPYSFAHNNPILFNDPLGLNPQDSVRAPDGEMVADKGSMPEVVIVGIPNGFWAKQRLYYDIMSSLERQGATIDQIQQDDLREMMYRFDAITKNREAVNESTRAGDEIFLEAISWLIPETEILKIAQLRKLALLFKLKRGVKDAKIFRAVGAAMKGFDKVLQSGGNTLKKSTLKALRLTKEEGKIAIEALKKDLGLPSDFHGKIMGNGDLRNDAGDVLGNLLDYLPNK